MSEKMLIDEQAEQCLLAWDNGDMSTKEVVRNIRLGTIPAENAVVIPDVKDWPNTNAVGDLIQGIGLYFTSEEDEDSFFSMWGPNGIKYIPRPKPVWAPKVGGAVFVDDTCDTNYILVTKIHDIDKEGRCEMVGHFGTWWHITHIKPFHESHIGKPWDEIPGGVE